MLAGLFEVALMWLLFEVISFAFHLCFRREGTE